MPPGSNLRNGAGPDSERKQMLTHPPLPPPAQLSQHWQLLPGQTGDHDLESKAGSKGPLCHRPSDLLFLWPPPSVFSKHCLASGNPVLSCPVLSCLDLGSVIFHFLVQSTATLSKHHESSTRSNGHSVRQETTAHQAWMEQASALASPAACSLSCILNPSTISPHTRWHWAAS